MRLLQKKAEVVNCFLVGTIWWALFEVFRVFEDERKAFWATFGIKRFWEIEEEEEVGNLEG